ncbi:MAG: HAD family hydrolase [Acholeplasmataceae bacterium]
MKRIIFFDLDQTIFNNDLGIIPPQTEKLLITLSKTPDVILGLATGRSMPMLQMIEKYLHLFEYLVLVNGGVVYHRSEKLFDYPIDPQALKVLIDDAIESDIILGMVNDQDEAITHHDDRVSYQHTGLKGFFPSVNPLLYQSKSIYQVWLIAHQKSDLIAFEKRHPSWLMYYWRKGGADMIYGMVSKGRSISHLLKDLAYDQLICVGDGENDVEMIEVADIGIAMGNSISSILKEKADLIAPHIEADQLYEFFEKNELI